MNAVLACLTIIYPLGIYLSIKSDYTFFSAVIVGLVLLLKGILMARAKGLPLALTVVALGGLSLFVFVGCLKIPNLPLFYPVMVNLALLVIFVGSLKSPVTIIERFATIAHGPLPMEGSRYCRKVCKAWCAFIFLNLLISLDSTSRSLAWWSLYNGLISYLAIGAMALGEYLVRRRVLRRHGLVALILLFLSLVSTAHANSTPTIEQLRERLKSPAPFRSAVTETRYVAVLTAPLESTGRITCLPGEGIVWETAAPIRQTTVITPHDVTIIDSDGRKKTITDQASISEALLSLMSGGVEQASENFTLTTSGTAERWVITMTPRDALVSEILTSIKVSGGSRPETIEITHTNDDRIVQSFSPPTALSPSEITVAQNTLHAGP